MSDSAEFCANFPKCQHTPGASGYCSCCKPKPAAMPEAEAKPEKPTKVEPLESLEARINEDLNAGKTTRGDEWTKGYRAGLTATLFWLRYYRANAGACCRRCLSQTVADGVELCEGCDEIKRDQAKVAAAVRAHAKPAPSPVPAEPAPEGLLTFEKAIVAWRDGGDGAVQARHTPQSEWFDMEARCGFPPDIHNLARWATREYRLKPKPVPAPRPSRVRELCEEWRSNPAPRSGEELATRAVNEALEAAHKHMLATGSLRVYADQIRGRAKADMLEARDAER